jgi:hypothetical protein
MKKQENNKDSHVLMTYEELKNGFKKVEKIEPYPIRRGDNCHTKILCEIRFNTGDPLKRIATFVGRAKDEELIEIVKRDLNTSGWTGRKDCEVSIITVSYWNLDYRREVNVLVK